MPIQHRLALSIALATAAATCPVTSAFAVPRHESAPDPLPEIERLRSDRQWLAALAHIERAQTQRPDDEQLYRLQVLTLADLGGAERAWSLAQARPALFSDAERQRLSSDRLARRVLWGTLFPENEAQRLSEMRDACGILEQHRAGQTPAQQQAELRTRFDELVMLNHLERHAEVVQRYRALQAENVQLPMYALAKVGASLLADKHPEEAASVLEHVVREWPDDNDSQLQLAYAYSESERFDDAYAQLDKIKAAEPAFVRVKGAKESHENWRHYDADSHQTMIRLYGEDTVGAQRRLEEMAAIGPNNAGLQSDLGVTYQKRGWTDRALERFQMASTMEPTNVGARIGQIGAYLEHDRVDLARPIHDELLANRARDVQVKQMAQSWDQRLGWQWLIGTAGGRSDARGGGATASPLGSRDGEHRFEIMSPLIHDRWRLTAHARDAWADYPDGALRTERVHDRRSGVGGLYAYDRLTVGFGVDRANDHWLDRSDRTGYYLDAGWRFNDLWRGTASWYRGTPEASLQARRAGIDADAFSLGLRYTPSERTSLSASAQQLRYSDDNTRTAFGLSGAQRLYTQPHVLIDGLADLATSRASRRDSEVPYFNPSRDASLNLGLRIDHLAWRRYERHFRQRLTVQAGPYWQQGYGSYWVPQVRYEHEWRFATGRTLDYGINWSRPVYDGVREDRLGFDMTFRWGEQ
ncbi:Biofilm PGA outer membrane secretin PgaA [Lysobacter capsici AZ78]|uniref:Biofilm PGA outer membrane secretin PgaA n=2 Tax=Lysobacter capsici TaxID=435897 RepID=A0A108U4D6_9GAMM|nr:Biofilm PGA outer membrane secretin PgaA [Lysobacter capsici AZ78]